VDYLPPQKNSRERGSHVQKKNKGRGEKDATRSLVTQTYRKGRVGGVATSNKRRQTGTSLPSKTGKSSVLSVCDRNPRYENPKTTKVVREKKFQDE